MKSKNSLSSLMHQHSTKDLADKLGVTPTTVSNWRAGRTKPARHHRQELSRHLGVSVSDLHECIANDKGVGRFHVIARRISLLPSKARKVVLGTIRAFEDPKGKGGNQWHGKSRQGW